MNRNPTPAQVGAALAAYDERIGPDAAPSLRTRHAAMLAALRAAADFTRTTSGGQHDVQRNTTG
jgi:hypothetical protein